MYSSSVTVTVTPKDMGEGVCFQRVRRITGYLAYVDKFNNGKKAELSDRVKHDSIVKQR